MPNGLFDLCDDFERGYIACALWTSELDDVSGSDLPLEIVERMREDCSRFRLSVEGDKVVTHLTPAQMLGVADSQLGHDFWLTRNRHGAGFWDRGLGDVGEVLTKRAQSFGECSLTRDDDGTIYLEP
jgi:hypothetical protein